MKKTTYKKLILKIILITLTFSLSIAFIYTQYMKEEAIEKLSKVDARKTTQLVFQSLYSAMEKGWTRDDLEKIIFRLNEIDKKQLNNFISDYINVKVVPIAVRNDILEIMTVFQDIRFWIDLKTLKFTTADQYETAKTVIKNVEDIPGFFEKAQKLIEQRDKNS